MRRYGSLININPSGQNVPEFKTFGNRLMDEVILNWLDVILCIIIYASVVIRDIRVSR